MDLSVFFSTLSLADRIIALTLAVYPFVLFAQAVVHIGGRAGRCLR